MVKYICSPLLPDTELAKDHVEQILNIHPSQKTSERKRGDAQLLSCELLAQVDGRDAPAKRCSGLAQPRPLPLSRDQAVLRRAELVPRETDQSFQQI